MKKTCFFKNREDLGRGHIKKGSSKENIQDLTKEDDDLSDEEMFEFECE
jgi:hypothetical protein